MAYTVLARRYRSDRFDQVIGQEPIARALRNAIERDRVAHAYLFTGTRGVGKTSMARLFARALNAPDTFPDPTRPAGDDDFPPEDVQQRMAQAIMRGDDLNVIEIDGASNNSVEQARQLIGNAGLAPSGQARFKVYIIDEVHMLSGAAFNALLKTMEEPPAHVKFVLCTTESHKVPVTIQSRCQRFDFRNIATPRIAEHLRSVADSEQIEADDEVLWQVARLAAGSMRDGLSLLDRLIVAADGPLSTELLERMLGLPPQQRVGELVEAIATGDAGGVLRVAGEMLDGGVMPDQFLDVLIDRLRQLMLARACGDAAPIEAPKEAVEAMREQAGRFDVLALVHMIALCESVQRSIKSSATPRALLDAGLVRLAAAEKMLDLAGLVDARTEGGPPKKA